jgi:hypothetical protein
VDNAMRGRARYYNPRKYLLENLKDYRKRWLKVLKKYPQDNRKLLMTKAYSPYSWLSRHDRVWLEAHLPAPLKVCRKREHLDWHEIDKKLCEEIKKACSEILQSENPIRISLTEIIRRVGHKSWIEKRDKKLPLTTELIKNSLESLEDFMIRKLKSAEKKYIERKYLPTRSQLIREASINNATTENSIKIQGEIDKSLVRMRKKLQLF